MTTTELARSSGEDQPPAQRRSRLRALALPPELTGAGTRPVVASWLVSRALTLTLLALWESTASGDVGYYARSLHMLFAGGQLRSVLQEYPLPVFGIMLPQYLIGALNSVAFSVLFALSMLAVDAAFTRAVWVHGGRARTPALRFWLWFVPLVGPMAYFRFDIVTAALAGVAVLACLRRPARTGLYTAVGAALKLWPVVMLPIFLLRRGGRRAMLAWFFCAGVVLAGASLLIGGAGRLFSPLAWQAHRGLQIESVIATPLMLVRAVHSHHPWRVHISAYNAYELFGAGVHPITRLTTVLTVAGLVLLAWLWWRAHRLPAVPARTIAWLALATTTVITVTAKTLSPQYILWLGGTLAALLLIAPGDPTVRRTARLLLVIAGVTQVEFPTFYSNLVHVHALTLPITLVLTLRNVLLVRLAWVACAEVWRQTKRPYPARPHPPLP